MFSRVGETIGLYSLRPDERPVTDARASCRTSVENSSDLSSSRIYSVVICDCTTVITARKYLEFPANTGKVVSYEAIISTR
jgi:hypothetical protein